MFLAIATNIPAILIAGFVVTYDLLRYCKESLERKYPKNATNEKNRMSSFLYKVQFLVFDFEVKYDPCYLNLFKFTITI